MPSIIDQALVAKKYFTGVIMNAVNKLNMTRHEKRMLAFFVGCFVLGFATIAMRFLVPDFSGNDLGLDALVDLDGLTPAVTGSILSLGSLFVAFRL
jgi:hypothetical protein